MSGPSLYESDDSGGVEPVLGHLGRPTYWPMVLREDAGYAWAVLRVWVEDLVDRFGLDSRTVPPCWFRHNGHVEALAALFDYERMSFYPTASLAGPVDFFRALREIEYRLVEWSARTQCSVNEHRPDPVRAWSTDETEWEYFVNTGDDP